MRSVTLPDLSQHARLLPRLRPHLRLRRRWLVVMGLATCVLASSAGAAAAAPSSPQQPGCGPGQSPADAWWTGPMLANSANTLPRGHLLLEPYVYDVVARGSFDRDGVRHRGPAANGFGSLTYAIYGVADRFGLGFIPTAGFNTISGGSNSSGVGFGDAGVTAQYRLTPMRPCSRLPTISIAVQETLPTGRFDRLGDRPSDGFGSGAYTTQLSIYTQKYLWMPNGRIVRMRVNFSQSFSSRVRIADVSVYGTDAGFHGEATPGSSSFVNGAWEYSLTRRWVLALDATYRYARNTRVSGTDAGVGAAASLVMDSGTSHAVGLAPAIEYNWTPNVGVLVGVRVIAAGRNTSSSLTPAIAINYVH